MCAGVAPSWHWWRGWALAARWRHPRQHRRAAALLRRAIPAIFGKKVRVTGVFYYTGFESPNALAVDGEPVNVDVQAAPELYAFAAEHGIDLSAPSNASRSFDPSFAPWDLVGYLAPGPCYRPGYKTFHVLEAYPKSLPSAERTALEAELREQYRP